MNSTGIWSVAETEQILKLSDEFKSDKVRNFMKQFILTDEDITTLTRLFDKEMDDGLLTDKSSVPENNSQMAMDVTYFTEFFDGTESGDYVVINLRAQNLILVLARVKPGFPVKTTRKYFTVDDTVRRSPYIKIFEYLCDCLLIFFTENNLLNKTQLLGFCTDFPMIQFDIDKAIINYFTMAASEYPLNSYDIGKCFEMVLVKERYKDLKFILIAVMSNNMSLLMHSSYIYGPIDIFINLDNDCGLIYREELKNVKKWKSTHSEAKQHVWIDTGIRNFGKSGTLDFITTTLDWSVLSTPLSLTHADKKCRLEKFLSDKYILELIRLILTTLHHEMVYCRRGDIGKLYHVNGISLADLLNFLNTEDLNHASQLLPGGTIGVTNEDALIAKYVCTIVFIRAALLLSICLSRIFMRFEKDDFIIALKCPLLEKYFSFETYVRNFIGILAPLKKVQIFTVKDDVSVEGAALATSIIHRQNKK